MTGKKSTRVFAICDGHPIWYSVIVAVPVSSWMIAGLDFRIYLLFLFFDDFHQSAEYKKAGVATDATSV
jgi:hypothetical protein